MTLLVLLSATGSRASMGMTAVLCFPEAEDMKLLGEGGMESEEEKEEEDTRKEGAVGGGVIWER